MFFHVRGVEMKLKGPRKSFLLFHSKRPTAFVELKGAPGARRVEDGRGGWPGRAWHEDGELGRRHMQNFGARVGISDFVPSIIGSH